MTRTSSPDRSLISARTSAWFRASRIALVATGITSSIRDESQNAAKTAAVDAARSTGSGRSIASSPMPSLIRTGSRISSVRIQTRPSS
jgi:hypothetical protein